MKKGIRLLTLAALMSIGLNAHAGAGLSVGAIANLAQGNFLASAIGGGLGAASIVHGVNLVQKGKIGWGVFFLILADEKVIANEDVAALEGLDVANKEAFLEIITSEEAPEAKEVALKALFE